MKYIKLLAAAAALMMLIACSNQENGQTSEEQSGTAVLTESKSAESESESEPEPEPVPEPEPAPEPDRSKAYVYEQNPALTPVDYDSPALLPISEDLGQEYQNSIVFLCDSPTYWMGPFGLLDGGSGMEQIWTGPEGTMTLAYQSSYSILDPYDQTEKPIRDVVEQHKPERMIIALGINGIMFMDKDSFTAEYKDLVSDIKELSPETDVIFQSIYPITTAYKNWGAITNVMITEANSWILDMAEELGCKYLDSFSVLVGDDGNAKPELMQKDGLHPNEEGLTLVLEYIRTHGHRTESVAKS